MMNVMMVAEGLNVMIKVMVEYNIFTGYNIGAHNPTVISHL